MRFSSCALLIAATQVCLGLSKMVPASEFYSLVAEDTEGRPFEFARLRGASAVVITNVASQCGYTDSNYRDFASLVSTPGVQVLAFPCNQFGAQEPGSNDEIKAFAAQYGLSTEGDGSNFHLMSKVIVNGPGTHPVYNFLKGHTSSEPIKWNFYTKFTVVCDEESCDVKRLEDVLPSKAIKKALASGKTKGSEL
mmetsp:Transcript_29035/g.43897  ORF Transcript_29035/g.43897 Transcript_29035/m.43897 type:complete len:194 (+) Transcript_29035:70-651(+)